MVLTVIRMALGQASSPQIRCERSMIAACPAVVVLVKRHDHPS